MFNRVVGGEPGIQANHAARLASGRFREDRGRGFLLPADARDALGEGSGLLGRERKRFNSRRERDVGVEQHRDTTSSAEIAPAASAE